MDYLGYYKLALQKTYGGDFPEMSPEEFDRRCALKEVPIALKALYQALGTQRICRMHCLIPMPEELVASGEAVIVHKEDDRIWAIHVDDLAVENPLIQARTECIQNEDGTEDWHFSHDGETRLAVQMANLIAYSAGSTYEIRQSARYGKLNTIRNCFAFITRKRELLLNFLCIVLQTVFIQSKISFILNDRNPALGELSILCFFLILLIPVYSIGRLYFYWNVWIGWSDNTRFSSYNDKLFLLIHDLTLHYLRWNRPDLWFYGGAGNVEYHAEVALRGGSERFCQGRCEVISDKAVTLYFPAYPPVVTIPGKQSSILFRTTLDESGCLKFLYINTHCTWRLPKKKCLHLNSPTIHQEVRSYKRVQTPSRSETSTPDLSDECRKRILKYNWRQIPEFPYMPNVYRDGIIVRQSGECDCCGQKADYLYFGIIYCTHEVTRLCPWCIAEGVAAMKYNGTFNDLCADVTPEINDIISCRTPAISGWQDVQWETCCNDAMLYLEAVGTKKALEKYRGNTAVENTIHDFEPFPEFDLLQAELPDKGESSLLVHVFQCRHCGKYKLYFDAD